MISKYRKEFVKKICWPTRPSMSASQTSLSPTAGRARRPLEERDPSNSSQLISGMRSIYPTSHPVQGLAVGFVIMFRCSHGGQLLVGRLKLQVPFCLRLRRLGEWNYLAHPQSYARLFSCSFGGSKRSIHVTTCTSLPTYAFLCFGALKGCLVNSDFLRSCKTYNVILHELFENFRKNAVMN